MLRISTGLSLPAKTTLAAVAVMIVAVAAVASAILAAVTADAERAAQARQERSLLVTATLLQRAHPEFRFAVDGEGHVTRIDAPAIPEFADHAMIDEIGALTGETATVFAWDGARGDFFRRTTNIRAADGSRAVGTPLGTASAAFDPVVGGERYRGEAVIFGQSYRTVYQPIFDAGGRVVGLLYVGVSAAAIAAAQATVIHNALLAGGITMLLGAIAVALVAVVVLRPVPRLTRTMVDLAAGKTDVAIPYLDRRSDVGAMAGALAAFARAVDAWWSTRRAWA